MTTQENHGFTHEEQKIVLHCAYAQAILIGIGAFIFPSMGVSIAFMASAFCLIPLAMTWAKTQKLKLFSVALSSIVLAPLYWMFCEKVFQIAKMQVFL